MQVLKVLISNLNIFLIHWYFNFIYQVLKTKKLKVGYQTKKIKNKKIRIIFQILNLKTNFERKIATNISRFL